MKVPVIISKSALAAAWQKWTHSLAARGALPGLPKSEAVQSRAPQHPRPSQGLLEAEGQKPVVNAAQMAEATPAKGQTASVSMAHASSGLVIREDTDAESDCLQEQAGQQPRGYGLPSKASPLHISPLPLQHSPRHMQPDGSLGDFPFGIGGDRTAQATLQELRRSPDNQCLSTNLADHVVAIMSGSSWASGIIVHSSGVILTVAHAIKSQGNSFPTQSSSSSPEIDGPASMQAPQ